MFKRLTLLLALVVLQVPLVAVETGGSAYEHKLEALDEDDAQDHFQLALWCKENRLYEEYREHLQKTLEIDPDHGIARNVLGYEKVGGVWLRGEELKIAKGFVLHEGKWVTPEDQEKLEAGMVEYRGRWMSEEDYYEAKGYVQHRGHWISKSRHRMMQARLEKFRKFISRSQEWENAFEFETKYFKIKTNTVPIVAKEIGIAMDMCYERLQKVFGVRRPSNRVPLEVYATQRQFMRGSAESGIPISPGVLGYFYWGFRGKGIRCFYTGSIEQTLSTLFHECTHLAIHDLVGGGNVPTWSNEGPAVMFEDAVRREREIDIIAVPWGRLWHLKEQIEGTGGTIDLSELVRINGGYPGSYYPRGWGLMYFLLNYENGKYRRGLASYFREVAKTNGTRENMDLFMRHFKVGPSEIEDDWHAYIEAIEPETVEDFIGAAQAASSIRFDLDRALSYAEKAIEMDDDNWEARLAFARVKLAEGYMSEGEDSRQAFAAAIEAFEAALEESGYDDVDKLARAARSRSKSVLHPLQMHVDYGRACIGGHEYEKAAEALENVLSVFELSSASYKYMALMHATAEDDNYRDIEEAERLLEIADDLGDNHENRYVEAMIAKEKGEEKKAVSLLRKAAQDASYSFGAHLYRREIARIRGHAGGEGDGRKTIIHVPEGDAE